MNKEEFVEFKTSVLIESPRQETTFRKFKTIKWWTQSFLVGISTLICGFRDNDGIVEVLKSYRIKDLPKEGGDYWSASVAIIVSKAANL